MLVTGVSPTAFTVTRAAEGTIAASHLNGATVTNIVLPPVGRVDTLVAANPIDWDADGQHDDASPAQDVNFDNFGSGSQLGTSALPGFNDWAGLL